MSLARLTFAPPAVDLPRPAELEKPDLAGAALVAVRDAGRAGVGARVALLLDGGPARVLGPLPIAVPLGELTEEGRPLAAGPHELVALLLGEGSGVATAPTGEPLATVTAFAVGSGGASAATSTAAARLAVVGPPGTLNGPAQAPGAEFSLAVIAGSAPGSPRVRVSARGPRGLSSVELRTAGRYAVDGLTAGDHLFTFELLGAEAAPGWGRVERRVTVNPEIVAPEPR